MMPCIDNDNMEAEFFSDASCDSVNSFFGGNKKPSSEVGNALKKKK